ncbi:hypothetical protein DWX10_28710 [Clostridium sp. AF18-27]|jgi:hypothetical protein|uniref:hypothetical protein n=1 Tax=Enterocloster lavalensis TaxID=460384 RepID=UPI000E4E092C|nr:hypothetical protein [Enterocloster lavalensis]MBS5607641.1 hypothetical protein [Enterocloster asparagiformis]MCB6343351.1 hypothetical protein [Enterocloster lavalensis]RHR44675.1 hypothetical protein DWX10_28710 [Clostridium sp. AF18-27]
MIFGDYNQGRVFKIENSQMHKEAGSRVRSVEFILLKGKNGLWFIEAKSSSPKSETSWDRYQEFIGEITEKFIHSFNMLCAWYLGRLSDYDEIGTDLKAITGKMADFVFVLVIRGHKMEWLLPLQEELRQKLKYHNSIWNSKIIVMNDEIAREYHLII